MGREGSYRGGPSIGTRLPRIALSGLEISIFGRLLGVPLCYTQAITLRAFSPEGEKSNGCKNSTKAAIKAATKAPESLTLGEISG